MESPILQDDLHVRAARRLGSPICDRHFADALASLVAKRDVTRDARKVRRSEPDFPERVLEDPIQTWLFGDAAFAQLRLSQEHAVVQRTTVGGRQGSGLWSRPDFTIATIRQRKYDPLRHLDVLAFELKNLAGASLLSVHEALAHSRFAHYAYLICPRSLVHPEYLGDIQQNCVAHGVGLISFSMGIGEHQAPRVSDVRIEVSAARKAPDPDLVDRYIEDRMTPENAARLQRIAQGI